MTILNFVLAYFLCGLLVYFIALTQENIPALKYRTPSWRARVAWFSTLLLLWPAEPLMVLGWYNADGPDPICRVAWAIEKALSR